LASTATTAPRATIAPTAIPAVPRNEIHATYRVTNRSGSKIGFIHPIICDGNLSPADVKNELLDLVGHHIDTFTKETYSEHCYVFDDMTHGNSIENTIGKGANNGDTKTIAPVPYVFARDNKLRILTTPKKPFLISCAWLKLPFGLTFNPCTPQLGSTAESVGAKGLIFDIVLEIDGKIGTSFAFSNETGNKTISEVVIKTCDSTGQCEESKEEVNLAPGQKATVAKEYSTIAGKQLDPSKRYSTSCEMLLSDGTRASCSQNAVQYDNPLYVNVALRGTNSASTTVQTEQQLADVNHDKANNALDCAKMFSNYNTPGADANRDGKTDALDVSLCHKWGFLKSK
jgi:hypothetical protein